MSEEAESYCDPFIEEVRNRRRAVFARYGKDLRRLCEAIQQREAEHPEKVVTPRKDKLRDISSVGSA